MSKKILSLLLVIVMLVGCFTGCKLINKIFGKDKGDDVVAKEYTYKSWASSLGTNWNPHTWENNADSAMMGYIESPLVDLSVLNSEEGTYQWVYEMATSIKDVTADHQDDLTKYGSILPAGKTAADVTEDYVYEIKLNPNAKWETGEPINADTYIYSMQMLLSSKMRNYRANNYIAGSSAIAGAMGYYNSESPIYSLAIDLESEEKLNGNNPIYVGLNQGWALNSSYSLAALLELGYIYDEEDDPETPEVDESACGATYYEELKELENSYGYIEVNETTVEKLNYIISQFLVAFGIDGTDPANEIYLWTFYYYVSGVGDKVEYDTVGLYKVDDYTIRYVCENAYEYNYFLTSCTSNWLVHKATYEANMKEEGGLTVTTYGTSKDTTVSYGPYKMESFEDDKQVVFVQNENWYGYTKNDDGTLYSETNFEVDGKTRQQYQTTKIVIDVMEQKAAYSKFLAGELTDYAPTADELIEYTLSDRLYRVDETYTMRWFFNCALNTLKSLDDGANNENSVVLSNYNFRKAMSLAINRADFVTATEGWKPAYSLMNQLYFYDVYNDPTSSYRNSDVAMQAICNLYGVQYGEGTPYKNLEEAYKSITGYNLTEAKALMKQACDELVAANLYTRGADIEIQIAWKAGAMEAADNQQLEKLNQYLNAAMEGSGFGKITFTAADNLKTRYDDVIAGKYAIGWGAWGGAAFYPFGMMQCYMDPSYTKIHESGCWKPDVEELTLTFTNSLGETVTHTHTWQYWSANLESGEYMNETNEVKLAILAQLEEKYLDLYYCIPMAGTTICSLLSYQVDEYTDNYNIMYGFGGFRLMTWNFTDAEWSKYVADQGGTLNYK